MATKPRTRVERRLSAVYAARRKFLRADHRCVMVFLFDKKIREIVEEEHRNVS